MMGFRVRLWFSLFIDIFLMGLSGLTFCAVVLETTEKVLFHPGVESFPKTAAILLILAVLLISMLWIVVEFFGMIRDTRPSFFR